jgi:membrane protein YqaA with SNARE-associated domain
MFKALNARVLGWAHHPKALWILALVAFAESSFFPIPPDLLMIPMILAAPSRAFVIAGVAMVASVLGGLLGYAIGALAFETIGEPMLAALGKADSMEAFSTKFNDFGFWAVLIAGITPFPYKVITIMSGWTGMPLLTFLATSIMARGGRFFLVAGLLWAFGPRVRALIERWLGLILLAAVAVVILSLVLAGQI